MNLFPPVRLYLDDFQEIHSLLVSKARKVQIEADGYEVPTPDDLPQLGPIIRNFNVISFDPMVSLTLSPNLVSTYCEDVRDTVAYGLMSQIDVLVRRRQVPFAWIRQWHLLAIQWLCAATSFLLPRGPLSLFLAAVTGLLAFAVLLVSRRQSRRGLLITHASTARSNWFERNQDAFTVALVAGLVVTVLGGLIVAAMITFLSPPPQQP